MNNLFLGLCILALVLAAILRFTPSVVKWYKSGNKCRFSNECQHYQKYGYDCNSGRDVPKCGIYRAVLNGKRERLKSSDDFDMKKFKEDNK